MHRPYDALTPDEMAQWDAAQRHAEEVREREPVGDPSTSSGQDLADELRDIADVMRDRWTPEGLALIEESVLIDWSDRLRAVADRLSAGS